MVVSNQHTHRSSASAPGQPSKPRRKSSLNKQTERESPISINTSQNYSNTTNSRHHHHHHQHPRTLSSGSPHPSHERSRQSSAHIIHSNNNSNSTLAPSPQPVPRLSIADRFMYSNPAGASTATLSTPSATTPITTMSNSVQPEPAPMGGNGRLSVADRFMNSSPSTPAPINTSNYQKERSLSTFSGKTLASRNPSLLPTPSTDAQIERLTIASAFMKSTAESALSSPATYGRSREASVGDSDMGVGNKSTYSKTLYSNSKQDYLFFIFFHSFYGKKKD